MGVDLYGCVVVVEHYRFPHTRGGGPSSQRAAMGFNAFSPHAWGWTALLAMLWMHKEVFPTRVGVDLFVPDCQCDPERFPHTRGGGPLWKF